MGTALTKRPTALPREAADQAAEIREIGEKIGAALARCSDGAGEYLKLSIDRGHRLNAIKSGKTVAHGQWLDFLAACSLNRRTAQRDMQLARQIDDPKAQHAAHSSNGSIRAALRALTPPQPKKRSPKIKSIPAVTAEPRLSRLGMGHLRDTYTAVGLQAWIATIPADQRNAAMALLKAPVIETTKIGEEFVDARALRH
jgi:hypothetical protein